MWLAYAATEENVAKFTAELDLDSEQAAKNTPLVDKMLKQIEVKAPRPAFEALARFREHNRKAFNSYAHAGIHPLRRHQDGYPAGLLHGVLCNANGLAVMSCMQAAVLGGEQPLQQVIQDIAARHPTCMPASL